VSSCLDRKVEGAKASARGINTRDERRRGGGFRKKRELGEGVGLAGGTMAAECSRTETSSPGGVG
jgi:hypothetical protein